ncbi:type IV toxin-antitoxin system AbiEi family antitoxin domain-containing protein [Alkalibacterium sp. MB6]|uniref:type IV toxin-antitoxin system AbiEi family antitoxin domain-containing protein n=1 Tax=Alkalibacterium sp. MB6 TaxID=2081965 RepID=UPI00137A7802|nr:type IV toxin-antitoxin system AbiEi family antitoxin domain-containing protein [Alkalibacterium sp. MB6]
MTTSDIQDYLEKNKYFEAKEANKYGISNERLHLLEEQGKIERVDHGIYVGSHQEIDMLYVYQRRRNIIYSHETALYLHDLTDRDPLNYSVSVSRGYNSRKLKELGFDVYYVKKELYQLGEIEIETIFGNKVKVYSMERTLCDIVRSQSRMDKSVIIDAFKTYSHRKNKDLHTLMDLAKRFKVTNQIKQYLEVLL